MFKLIKQSKKSAARLGQLKTAHGIVQTPFFMPIATKAAVKNLTSEELKSLRAEIILSNTYHLWLRPGLEVIKKAGGLHRFMQWPGPILTDSGGYQVFSLTKFRKLTPTGVEFRDPQDGQKYFLTPELAIKIQKVLGSDIMMALDECPPYPASRKYVAQSLALTTDWAKRSLREFKKLQISKAKTQKNSKFQNPNSKKLLFGIVQGGVYKDLRLQSAKELTKLNFSGYALGGLAVGEPVKKMYQVLDWTVPRLPANKLRYLMGVGLPEQIIESVKRGIDMFDCVIPTREARHGRIYIWNQELRIRNKAKKKNPNSLFLIYSSKFYQTLNIANSKFSLENKPLDANCSCYTCQHHSRAYLRHLYLSKEPLALRLLTIHNLKFYLELMSKIKTAIKNNSL